MADVTISEERLAELLKEARDGGAQDQAQAASSGVKPAELLVPGRALLADGTTHDYVGAHPTHVDNGAGPVPVLSAYPV